MRFRPNSKFEAEIRAEAEVQGALVAAASRVKARAAANKHSIMPGSGSPLSVEVSGDEVSLVNHDHGAHLDEFGSAKNPPYAPLRRAVRASGLRLDEHGK